MAQSLSLQLTIAILPHDEQDGRYSLFINGLEVRDGTHSAPLTRHGADLAARAAISAWSSRLRGKTPAA